MRQGTAILLIGVILTVGLSLVSGVGVVDVSAADTLVVDQNGTTEYSSIQTAIDDASAGDTVEIRPGTYAETIVVDKNITVTAPDGATLDGTDVENPDDGVTIGNDEFDEAENVEPTIRGLTITRYGTGIESTADGDWVVSDVTIRIVQQNGIFAGSGDWTVRDSEVIATGLDGIDAGENGEWLIEDTVVRRTEFDGINARSTFDDWTIRNVSIQDSGDIDTSIDARDSDGNWVIEQTSVQDGVSASDSNGKWEIRQSVITGDVPVSAENTLGEWRIRQSIINEDEGTAIDATDAIGEGIATDNWWGSPSGPDENACVGNVDCSNPLTTRPSDVGYSPDDGDESTPTPTPTPTPDPPEGGITLSLSEDEAVQGSDTTFTIENSPEGEFHPVVIDESEFRDGVSLDQADDIFRNVGDTVETGVADSTGPGANDITDVEYAYAIVEIDGGDGVGSVETQFLDDSSATLELYPSDGVTVIESHPASVVLTADNAFETDDEEDLAVVEDDDSESPVDKYDANNDGEISIIELGQAGQAFASGELTITELGEVGAAFAS